MLIFLTLVTPPTLLARYTQFILRWTYLILHVKRYIFRGEKFTFVLEKNSFSVTFKSNTFNIFHPNKIFSSFKSGIVQYNYKLNWKNKHKNSFTEYTHAGEMRNGYKTAGQFFKKIKINQKSSKRWPLKNVSQYRATPSENLGKKISGPRASGIYRYVNSKGQSSFAVCFSMKFLMSLNPSRCASPRGVCPIKLNEMRGAPILW